MAARDSSADWVDYFTKRLDEAKKELADFEACCAKHGLRVRNNGADALPSSADRPSKTRSRNTKQRYAKEGRARGSRSRGLHPVAGIAALLVPKAGI
jgi:hypothetical protein